MITLDPKISLGNLIVAAGILASTVAMVVTLQESVEQNELRIAELEQAVADDRQFQIDQRIRVWNKVEKLSEVLNGLRADIRALEAVNTHFIRQVERLMPEPLVPD